MIETSDLRFLESSENVKRTIQRAFGREPSSDIAKGVAICLQQGRMFFEAAVDAPLEVRPLFLYYGMMAFAKAVIMGRSFKSLSTLSQAHGLRDISPQSAKISDLVVKVDGNGTFQELNNILCNQEGLSYFENAMSRRHVLATASSNQINGIQLTLKEIFARIPRLRELFRATYNEDPAVLPFLLYLLSSRQLRRHVSSFGAL